MHAADQVTAFQPLVARKVHRADIADEFGIQHGQPYIHGQVARIVDLLRQLSQIDDLWDVVGAISDIDQRAQRG